MRHARSQSDGVLTRGYFDSDEENFDPLDEFSEPPAFSSPESLAVLQPPESSHEDTVFFEFGGHRWIHCQLGDLCHSYAIEECLLSKTTQFQRCEVIKTKAHGVALFLDGVINSAESDEYIYHEALVHPAMLSHPNPKRVFIGGGGEGATLREVLRYKSVEKCYMVDIDGELVEFIKESPELEFYHQGAFEDPRTELIYADAKGALENMPDEYFDVIILDLADPVDCGPAFPLWTKEYYETCLQKLTSQGIFVTQAGPMTNIEVGVICGPCANTLGAAGFSSVTVYGCHVPSFPEEWAFVIAHKNSTNIAWEFWDVIDRKINKRIDRGSENLRYYDGVTHQRMFALSKDVRKILTAETRVATLAEPMCYGAGIQGTFI